MKTNDFLEKLGPVLDKISLENKTVVLLGDFNLDLLKFEIKPEICKFLDTLSSFLLKPQITLPTRITENSRSLIDNIFISAVPCSTTSGNFISGISDHLIQFSILNNTQFDNSFDKAKGFYRDWKNFNHESFSQIFNNIEWDYILQQEKHDPNLSFDNFFDHLQKLINNHVPLKRITQKQIKRQKKPWVTKGILRSMSIRDKLLKKFINAKDQANKTRFQEKYKIYRNMITNLLRASKTLHYKNFFNLNSTDTKKTWEGINEIIYKKKVSIKYCLKQKGHKNLRSI